MLLFKYNTLRTGNQTMLRLVSKYMFNNLNREAITSLTEIISKTPINHDSYIYQLKFVDTPIALSLGQHFRITETIKTYDAP